MSILLIGTTSITVQLITAIVAGVVTGKHVGVCRLRDGMLLMQWNRVLPLVPERRLHLIGGTVVRMLHVRWVVVVVLDLGLLGLVGLIGLVGLRLRVLVNRVNRLLDRWSNRWYIIRINWIYVRSINQRPRCYVNRINDLR